MTDVVTELELDLSALEEKLTWFPFENPGNAYSGFPLGTVIKDTDGEFHLVGDASWNGSDFGCGCCSYPITGASMAYLSELLND